jgi:hypothetical protein
MNDRRITSHINCEKRIAKLEAELDALDVKYVTVQHELAKTEKECQEQFRQLLGAGETFNKMKAELAAAKRIIRKQQDKLAALKCCGNCKWFRAVEYQECGHPDVPYENYYISAPDKCDFTPSRWTPRS